MSYVLSVMFVEDAQTHHGCDVVVVRIDQLRDRVPFGCLVRAPWLAGSRQLAQKAPIGSLPRSRELVHVWLCRLVVLGHFQTAYRPIRSPCRSPYTHWNAARVSVRRLSDTHSFKLGSREHGNAGSA